MKEEKKAPDLRFPGFTDPWEQRKLRDISSLITKGTTPLDKSGVGDVNFIKVENLDSNSGEVIPGSKISMDEHEGYLKRSQLKAGDILFSIAGTLGRVGIIKSSVLPANTNQALAIIRTKEGNINYISTALRGRAVTDFIHRNPTVGAQPNLSLEQVGNLEIPYPSLDEQKEIGDYFKRLDNLITLHQRKVDDLKTMKKCLLQKMLPKEGENTPELRFPGFTDPWEQRKLGDFGYVAMCKRVFKDQTAESGDIPFYKIGTFGGEPDAYISRDLFEEYKHLYSYPEKGDILISASGSIGRTVEYTGEDTYYQDSNIVWLKHDKTIVNSFLKHLYEVIRWSGIEGSTIKRLYNDNILKTEVMIPAAPEQEEIGKCFNNLDNLITLHQRKVDDLKTMKKCLLQKMFI